MDGMSPHKSFLLAHSNLARLGLSVPLLPHPVPSVQRAGVASSQFFITVTPLSPFLALDGVGSVPTNDRDESRSNNGRSFRAEAVRFHQKVLFLFILESLSWPCVSLSTDSCVKASLS